MTETANIAEMATTIAADLFTEFGWTAKGPKDEKWACVEPTHAVQHHPSDVVMWYDDPYSNRRIYCNFDLKSYAKDSITKATVGGALKSLSMATECANVSAGWKDKYSDDGVSGRVDGLLFVYNHDGLSERDFDELLTQVAEEDFTIGSGRRMVALGPAAIRYLVSVAHDIVHLRGKGEIQKGHTFLYPHLIAAKARNRLWPSATVETLTGPWQILSVGPTSFVMYYRANGSTVDEFKYVIDFLFRYQILDAGTTVRIRMLDADQNATAFLATAKDQYASHFYDLAEIRDRLKGVSVELITYTKPQFSTVEIGMNRRG